MKPSPVYLRMENPADMLSAHFLVESGQLEGEFMQEVEPPWTIWLFWEPSAPEAGSSKAAKLIPSQVWTEGSPASEMRPASWADLFRRFILRPEEASGIGDNVLVRTNEKTVFLDIIRRHFMLQQGLLEFAAFDGEQPFWLIRIRHPSIWALDQAAETGPMELFRQIPENEGLFLEKGWRITDPRNGVRLNRFKMFERSIVLLRHGGDSVFLNPTWQHATTVIEVKVDSPAVAQADETSRIVIVPRFRPSVEETPAGLWRVAEPERLKAIISNEAMKRFAGYSAWFCRDNVVWVLSAGAQTDRGIATLLTDAFPAFSPIERKIFLPIGKTLAPKLPEERLKQIFQCSQDDFLCLELEQKEPAGSAGGVPGETFMKATLLPIINQKKIESFISFMAEQAVQRADPHQTAWVFEFPDVKKNE